MQIDPGILMIIAGALFAGNLYWLKRLIDKIEKTAGDTCSTSAGLAKLSTDVNAIGGNVRELRGEIKELRRLELDIAVLKSQYGGEKKNAS